MNDNRSRVDRYAPALLPRAVAGALAQALDAVPVAVIMGARQTGKSTLAVLEGGDRPYLTLDDWTRCCRPGHPRWRWSGVFRP